MNYEEIGKEAVKAGYDGGGIWAVLSPAGKIAKLWKNDPLCCEPLWPDFSYPETEGAALAWIAEKVGEKNCFVTLEGGAWFCIAGKTAFGGIDKANAILDAIKSLNLGKKDNSPTGLNKRLLEVGFKEHTCLWGRGEDENFPNRVGDIKLLLRNGYIPIGSHPSTIGVATAWIRSFEKIGDTLHFWYNSQTGTWSIGGQTLYPTHDGFSSELEALVEFAEWAKEEGLMP